MRELRLGWVAAAMLVGLASVACRSPRSSESLAVRTTPVKVVGAHDFDPEGFTDSTVIDNAWFPLVPGTQFTWQGHATEDGERVRRAVVFTVTDLTKVIDGVRTVVAWDRDYNDGELEEVELAFFAQDDDGNVWHFGQYPEEYDGTKIVKTPTWIAGLDGALEGLTMRATPEAGTPSYSEGWGPDVRWDDRARVHSIGESSCVPVDCYDEVLVIDEFSRSEPGAFQLKYYAAGVGGIRVGWRGAAEEEREVMVLVKLVHLTPEQMTEVRDTVLAQEARAYELSEEVYGRTTPIER